MAFGLVFLSHYTKVLRHLAALVTPLLIELLPQDDPDYFDDISVFIIETLGTIGEPATEIVPALLKFVNVTPSLAENALIKIGTSTVPVLIALLEDSNKQDKLRSKAAWMLGRLIVEGVTVDSSQAIPALIDFLKDRNVKQDFWIQGHARYALARIGKPAIPALIEVLEDPAQHESVKTDAMATLHLILIRGVVIGQPVEDELRVLRALINDTEVDERSRNYARQALSRINGEDRHLLINTSL